MKQGRMEERSKEGREWENQMKNRGEEGRKRKERKGKEGSGRWVKDIGKLHRQAWMGRVKDIQGEWKSGGAGKKCWRERMGNSK